MELSNDDIYYELLDQSHDLFGAMGLGGVLGPRMEQFRIERPPGWPDPRSLLRTYGLLPKPEGWQDFLQGFGLAAPTLSDVQVAVLRRREQPPCKPCIPLDEEDDYALPGHYSEYVTETKQDDGSIHRKTVRVFHVR